MPAKYPSWDPTKRSWDSMMQRCYSENSNRFYRYGARGIVVCDRWHVYENFLADMGERPDGRSLDRIDNDKNYCPENCRWATKFEQAANKSNTVRIGESHLAELARISGLQRQTIRARMLAGWPEEKLLLPLGSRLRVGTSPKAIRERRKRENGGVAGMARSIDDALLIIKYGLMAVPVKAGQGACNARGFPSGGPHAQPPITPDAAPDLTCETAARKP